MVNIAAVNCKNAVKIGVISIIVLLMVPLGWEYQKYLNLRSPCFLPL